MKRGWTALLLLIFIFSFTGLLLAQGNDREAEEDLFALRERLIHLQVELGLMEEEQGEKWLTLLFYHQQSARPYGVFPFYLEGVWFHFSQWPTLEEKIASLKNYLQALEMLKALQKNGGECLEEAE